MTFDNLQKRNRWIKGGTLKALSLSALFLFSFLFLINLTSAWNFASSDDYSLINWTRYTTYQTVTNYTETDPVWTADKSSYTLLSVLNNGSYLNPEGTDTFIGNYSTFLTHITYDDVMNGTLKDYFDGLYIGIGTETESKWNANYSTFLLNNISITNALNTKLGISQWNATNTSYALLTELNNGSYLNVDTGIGNWTADKSSYTLLSVLNNGTYLNTDTFVANYSTFLTHVTTAVLNNGSYLNPAEYETKWNANYSTFLTHTTWATINNGTLWAQMINASTEPKWNANYSLIPTLAILNNGSYLNYAWNATNTSYMTGNNFTLQNTSMKNYIAVVNTSMDNLVDLNNASVTNALNTKLNLAGGTMTGNISLGTSGVRLTNGTANTAVIYHNGTGWIIRG